MRPSTALVLASWLGFAISSEVFHIDLDQTRRLFWQIDRKGASLRFQIHFPAGQWIALGFSDNGKHENADFCLFDGLHLQDMWTDDKGIWHLDEEQDCKSYRLKTFKNTSSLSFTRMFDTCHPNDYVIQKGTTHVVWAGGTGSVPGSALQAPNYGMSRTSLIKPLNHDPPLPKSTDAVDFTVPDVAVPNLETTYWCHVLNLPPYLIQKHHIVKFEPVITEGNEDIVHHMELFHCEVEAEVEVPMYSGSCSAANRPSTTQACKKVLAAWAMGATHFTYPEEAGLPIGGPEFNLFAMLEIHYNNPEIRKGVIDRSGVRLYLSGELRQFDAGVIELGLEYIDKMAIPPGQEAFTLTGHCIPECTQVSLPESGILIFGSQLHTHLTGTRVVTRHIRRGRELPMLNYDNHYSTHFQEIRPLENPVNLLPGDSLMTTCTYDTIGRSNITLGGFAITDEMCVNYIYYYPKIDLEVCKSSISDHDLKDFFDSLNRLEKQPTGSHLPISVAYNSVDWTPLRARVLSALYEDSDLAMQCNRSDGSRFPGNWDAMRPIFISQPLPPPQRQCL